MLVDIDPEKESQRQSRRSNAYDEDDEGPGINKVQCAPN